MKSLVLAIGGGSFNREVGVVPVVFRDSGPDKGRNGDGPFATHSERSKGGWFVKALDDGEYNLCGEGRCRHGFRILSVLGRRPAVVMEVE